MGMLSPNVGEICRALYVGRGEAASPSLSFEARPSTGWYLQGDNDVALSIAGAEVFVVRAAGVDLSDFTLTATSAQMLTAVTDETGTGLLVFNASPSFTGVIANAVGATALPSYTFTGDLNTGFSSATADTPIISAAGAAVFTGSASAITLGGAVDRLIGFTVEDARTAAVDLFPFTSTTTGSPAAGIGVGLSFIGDSGDESATSMGRVEFMYSDVGAGSEDSTFNIALRVAGVAPETKWAFLSTAATGLQMDLTHAATADRVVTFPDLTGTVTLTAGAQTLTDKTIGTSLTPGAGIFPSGAESYDSGVWINGSNFVTQIVVDLTNLDSSTTDGDILGDGTEADCHFGQITTAVNGVMAGGKVTCLEAPAGGQTDIDFYSATEATGAGDSAITGLTETALITSGAAWTSGRVLGMTAVPAANEYIYMTSGAAGTAAAYTAGKFLIEFYGT